MYELFSAVCAFMHRLCGAVRLSQDEGWLPRHVVWCYYLIILSDVSKPFITLF